MYLLEIYANVVYAAKSATRLIQCCHSLFNNSSSSNAFDLMINFYASTARMNGYIEREINLLFSYLLYDT